MHKILQNMSNSLCASSVQTSQNSDFFHKSIDSKFIHNSDSFVVTVVVFFYISAFDNVEQDIMIWNICFKDSTERLTVDAIIICKDIIYQGTSISCNSGGTIYHRI